MHCILSIQLLLCCHSFRFSAWNLESVHNFDLQTRNDIRKVLLKNVLPSIVLSIASTFCYSTPLEAVDLQKEIEIYQQVTLAESREPRRIMEEVSRNLQANKPFRPGVGEKDIVDARERILTLKPYLDEIERDVYRKNWNKLQDYLYIFSEQENAFVTLIDGLFPSSNDLDRTARTALSFEAKGVFLALEELREAAVEQQPKVSKLDYDIYILHKRRILFFFWCDAYISA